MIPAGHANVLAYVRKFPDQRCADIATALSVPASYVSVELRELVKAGKLRRKGNTQGTRYRIK